MAFTGDRIETAFFVDGKPFGSVVETDGTVSADFYIVARSRLSRVEIIQDGEVVYSTEDFHKDGRSVRLFDFSAGWGGRGKPISWDITMTVEGADLKDVQPRLKGEMIVDPLASPEDGDAVPVVERKANAVHMKARTSGNPTPTTDCTQGFSFSVDAAGAYSIAVDVIADYEGKRIEKHYSYGSEELGKGSASEYMDGFVSPAILLSREMGIGECSYELHRTFDVAHDGYIYVRAFEERGDTVWTTPVWVRKKQ